MMRNLELKIPPVPLLVMLAALMWATSILGSGLDFILPARGVFAASLVAAGAFICALGLVAFRSAGTTVNPLKPEKAASLVVSGVYRRTRNPMYLGFLFCLAGWAILLSNASAFVFLPGFIFYMNRFQIGPEERALSLRFGQQFVDYRARVRRWL